MEEEKYKSLLIVNESSDAQVTLYLYSTWDFICWLSLESKIIKPNEKCLHRSESRFKFKLVARFEDNRPKKVLLEADEWIEDKLFKITESLDVIEGKLADFPVEKTICLRKLQRDKELKSTNGRRNLYDILGLDMDQVRNMPKEEQIKAIKKGFRREIQRWHPDKNFGDDENAKEIIMAHEILLDDEKRARYHNEADYDKGFLSSKRWKAIFMPECFTSEQKKCYRERMIMFALSLGIAIGGIALTVGTAGLAAPVAVALGATFGGGFIGAGMQSLQHTVNRESVVDRCDKKKWLLKAGIGFLGGAATGGAAAGITAGVAGLGSAAAESAALSAGKYIAIGAGSGAVGGVLSSLATDAGRKFADGEDVTLKQVLAHAVCGAAIGAAAGTAGGVVTKSIVATQTSSAAANLEGEIGEQIVILTGARRLGNVLARNVSRALTESGTEAIMGSVAQFAEERLDDSVENRNPGEHFTSGVQNLAASAAKGLTVETGGALASHAWNEIKVGKRVNKELIRTPLVDIDETSVVGENEHITRARVRGDLSKENNEHLVNWQGDSKYSFRYQPLDTDEPSSAESSLSESETFSKNFEDNDDRDKSDARDVPEDCKFKYISEGDWISKMVVSYFLKGIKDIQEVSGSGKCVTVPSTARRVEVRFQVRRPFWGDVKKYDRFKRRWCQPNQPHVFRYYTPPPFCTFTISGDLWSEAVMAFSVQDKSEPEDCKFKYISEGPWISKMVVRYFQNGRENIKEVSGSRKFVTVPSTASRVEVRFEVKRPSWGEVKKYDRFKGRWYKPSEPHVFRYDTPPPLRTFTISGGLWCEAVMKVTNEYHDEINEM